MFTKYKNLIKIKKEPNLSQSAILKWPTLENKKKGYISQYNNFYSSIYLIQRRNFRNFSRKLKIYITITTIFVFSALIYYLLYKFMVSSIIEEQLKQKIFQLLPVAHAQECSKVLEKQEQTYIQYISDTIYEYRKPLAIAGAIVVVVLTSFLAYKYFEVDINSYFSNTSQSPIIPQNLEANVSSAILDQHALTLVRHIQEHNSLRTDLMTTESEQSLRTYMESPEYNFDELAGSVKKLISNGQVMVENGLDPDLLLTTDIINQEPITEMESNIFNFFELILEGKDVTDPSPTEDVRIIQVRAFMESMVQPTFDKERYEISIEKCLNYLTPEERDVVIYKITNM